MVLRCRDTGGWCNWEGRADIAEDLVEMACRHVQSAHFVKPTREFRETARMRIRDEVAGQRGSVPDAASPFGPWRPNDRYAV